MSAFRHVPFRDIEDGKSYVFLVLCDQCGTCLNYTKPIPTAKLRKVGARLAFGSALVTKPCPEGCFSAYSDCNFSTEELILEASEEEVS